MFVNLAYYLAETQSMDIWGAGVWCLNPCGLFFQMSGKNGCVAEGAVKIMGQRGV
jgi:hypothetical protein